MAEKRSIFDRITGTTEAYMRGLNDRITGGAWSGITDRVGATSPEARAAADAENPTASNLGKGTGSGLLAVALPAAGAASLAPGLAMGGVPALQDTARELDAKIPSKAPPKPQQAPQPQQSAGVLTQHLPGGQTVQTPLMPGVEQTTSGGSRTRGQTIADPREAAQVEKQDKLDEAAIADLEKKREIEREKALIELQASNDAAAIKAKREADIATEQGLFEAEVQRRTERANAAEGDYKRQLELSERDPKQRFWSKQDTATKVKSGISLILGIFGGLRDGSNVGAERIQQAIDDDTATVKQGLVEREKILERARGDVKGARDELRDKLELLDLRSAAALETVAAQAIARGKRLGIAESDLAGNEGIRKIQEEAANRKLAYFEKLRVNAKNSATWNRVTGTGAGGAAGDASQGERDAAAGLNELASSLTNLSSLPPLDGKVMAKVQENQTRMKAVEGKGIGNAITQMAGRAVGMVPSTELQGLNDDQKRAYNEWMSVRAAVQKVLSGQAASDAEKADIQQRTTPQPGDSPQMVAAKLENAKRFLENSRVRAGKLAATVATPTAQAPAAPQLPPGARIQRNKRTGETRIVLPDGRTMPMQ